MNNELYRKLTSITLMTIMFAGGMTIAIPGELPTAVAQTNTLSVSASAAGVFGGAQVIEIVIDDPDLAEVGDTSDTVPDVEVDGKTIAMTQATNGKWYAYVASTAIEGSDLVVDGGTAATDATLGSWEPVGTFLTGAPDFVGVDVDAAIRTFDFDGDVEITANRGDESITLDYDDHSDIATISVDRNDVPAEGQVHITISDFQLNLDPTADDVWTLTDGSAATYNNVIDTTLDPDGPSSIDLTGTSGKLTVSGSDKETAYDNEADTVIIDETGSNTGVFESSNSDDDSEISVKMGASDGSTFTIAYADDDQQVIVDSFDSTLELVADGTWNSGDTLTVRLTNENLNINTLKDDDMKITDPILPTMTFGTPLTITDFDLTPVNPGDSLADSGHDSGTVTLTASSDSTVINVELSAEQLAMFQNPNMYHYVNYYPDPDSDLVTDIMTDAQLIAPNGDNVTSTEIKPGLTRVQAQVGDGVDGLFALTFTTTNFDETLDTAGNNDALNTALNAINADAGNTIATAMTAASGSITTARSLTDAGTKATDINTALTGLRTTINDLTGVTAGDIITGVSVLKGDATFNADPPNVDADPAEPAITTPSQFETPSSLLAKIKAEILRNINTEPTTFALEVFTFGIVDGETVNDAIYRPLLEETSSDSGVFEGTIEYKMLNQLTVDDAGTYNDVVAVDDELVIILDDGYTGTSAPEVTYDGDHVREDAPTYTGEVSFDSATYRIADEVTVILVDPDLNVDADAIDIYTVDVTSTDKTATLLHLEIGGCTEVEGFTSFSLRESTDDSDTFEGTFDVPTRCPTDSTDADDSTTGEDISATYYDFRDSSGGTTEWGDSATIGADTGSVSFDRTVYPVPAEGSAVTVYV